MRYLYLCCFYYLFIILQFIWHEFDMLMFRGVGWNGRFIMDAVLVIFFTTASIWSVILSWNEKRWFPVLMHQGVFWGLFLLIGLVDTYW